jgi:cap1 methyltransferase
MLNRSPEWESDEIVSAKRRRHAPEDLPDVLADDFQTRDFYREVLEGVYTGQVINSWLRDDQTTFSSNEAVLEIVGVHDMSMFIKSLSQQLLQVKRKLWPAAERCAVAVHQNTGHPSSPQFEFSEARRWCNPMECLGEGKLRGLNQMFMNRSAIKLANIDAILDFRLTQNASSSPFLFVDLCGAPGGFSEYLMMRSQEVHHMVTHGMAPGSCRGYGMSLMGSNEHGNGTTWKLPQISEWNFAGTFHTQYKICSGVDGTGDIYAWENVDHLGREIQADLQSCGMQAIAKVHLVVADGGFDAQRDSECQEGLAQKLVLAEMAAGIDLLHPGGTFVIKMFGFQSSTIRTAMQSMNDMFQSIQVLKPISSRPASSERYVIFEGFYGLPAHLNRGASWLGRVLWGKAAVGSPAEYAAFNAYLDQMDVDILALNLKACFSILSVLDRKAAAVYAGDGNQSWNEERLPVNISSYKCAWRLD